MPTFTKILFSLKVVHVNHKSRKHRPWNCGVTEKFWAFDPSGRVEVVATESVTRLWQTQLCSCNGNYSVTTHGEVCSQVCGHMSWSVSTTKFLDSVAKSALWNLGLCKLFVFLPFFVFLFPFFFFFIFCSSCCCSCRCGHCCGCLTSCCSCLSSWCDTGSVAGNYHNVSSQGTWCSSTWCWSFALCYTISHSQCQPTRQNTRFSAGGRGCHAERTAGLDKWEPWK